MSRRRFSSGPRTCPRICPRTCRWPAVLLLIAGLTWAGAFAHAEERASDGREVHSRANWATLLVAYLGLGAAATGGAYLLRDNFVGRGIAVSAGTWGGAGVGAAAGYGLGQLRACATAECASEAAVPTFLGALLGGAAGGLLASWRTASPGPSRPLTTALGMTPFLIYVSLGTILDW